MSDGSELQRSDAATGNVHQLTVVSWMMEKAVAVMMMSDQVVM